MFSLFKPAPPELSLYGKLPLAKDYLRIGCGKGAALELREWLDQAFSTRAEAPLALARAMRFVVGAANGDPAVGCLWNSSDEGGKRPFPFALLVVRPRREARAALSDGLAALDGWWGALESLHASLERYADGRALLEDLRGRALEPRAGGAARSEPLDGARWVRAVWPAEREDGLAAAARAIGEWRRQGRRAPLRLPLAEGAPAAEQVHAWLAALARGGALAADALPNVFLPQDGGDAPTPPFALLAPGPLRPEIAAWLAAPGSGEEPRPGDLARLEGGRYAEGGEASGAALAAVLAAALVD